MLDRKVALGSGRITLLFATVASVSITVLILGTGAAVAQLQSAAGSDSTEQARLLLPDPPETWGELADLRATAVPGLVTASFSNISQNPEIQEALRRWDHSANQARRLMSGILGPDEPMAVSSLWVYEEQGVALQLAVAVFLRDGSVETEPLFATSREDERTVAALREWRQALVVAINSSNRVGVPELSGEVLRYAILAGDRSLVELWLSHLLQWDCEHSDTEDGCNECCDDTANNKINWGCGFASRLGGIGGCMVLGGPANPIGCLIGGAIADYLIQSGCVHSINRQRKGCKYSCGYQFELKRAY